MEFVCDSEEIRIQKSEDFNAKQILESGQIFRYTVEKDKFNIYSTNKTCRLICEKHRDIICTNNLKEFVHFFDLNRDYGEIKQALMGYPNMKNIISHGAGIRILNQDPIEMIISFIISANNNIPRIQKIIERLCYECGVRIDDYYAFPEINVLSSKGELFYRNIGAGYRAKYLVKTVDALANGFSLDLAGMNVVTARKHLMNLMGVGRKVADCIMLFAYHRTEVFPTDTWIEKYYDNLFGASDISVVKKADILSEYYGKLSGYAQQYIFYYMRSGHTVINER